MRVHRFAAVPTVAAAGAAAEPVVARTLLDGGDCARDALREVRAPWVALVAEGSRLVEGALELLGQAVRLAPDALVLTGDDAVAGRMWRGAKPRLRPGPSPDLWRCRDPGFSVLAVTRQSALAAMEPGDSLHGLFLRLSGPDGASHAHVPQVLCHRRSGPARDLTALRLRVCPPQDREPAVEVIVCLRDRPELLERCAGSLLTTTAYERLALRLVDNDTGDAETLALLDRLGRDPRVTIDRDSRPFSFSALNNAAAARSNADVLVFLNNDTEVVEPGWVEDLLGEAARAEVGAVSPLLTYPDGLVQHAGVAIGLHGWAGHPFAGLKPDEQTPFGSAAGGTRNWMAVSAACMMVEKRKFDEVGGFDESFAVGGGDVDLCLRLTAAGYRSLCVPRVRVIHDESATRDPSRVPAGDFEASRRSYGEFRTVGDPFYHPALTLRDTSCRLRAPDEQPPPP